MSRVLEITSGHRNRLTIDKGGEPYPQYWQAVLESPGLTATAQLDIFSPHLLRDYFAGLAANWRGWTGTRTWGGRRPRVRC